MVKHVRDQRWNSKFEYFLACLGFFVGIESFMRFPSLLFTGGGAAFLVPYFISLLLCGMPFLYMEMAVGQLARLGPLHSIVKLCPLLKGTGLTMVICSFITACYYNVMIAWTLHYFFYSFTNPLSWTNCDNDWNTPRCMPSLSQTNRTQPGDATYDENATYLDDQTFSSSALPSIEFFYNFVLGASDTDQYGSFVDYRGLGQLNLRLGGFLALASFLCFIGLSFGVKSIGKIAYCTVPLPLVILLVLLIRGLTLPGSFRGIMFGFYPNWSELTNFEMWMRAFSDHIYTFGVGFGTMITYSSYSTKRSNVLHNTLIFAFVSVLFRIIAAFVLLSFVGAISENIDVGIKLLDLPSARNLYGTIPYLFTFLPVSNLWAIIFFLMLAGFGISSQLASLEVVCTTLVDQIFPKLEKVEWWHRPIVSLSVCLICFLLGLPYVTERGIEFIWIIDMYNGYVPLVIVLFFEVMAVAWFYGSNRLARMVGFAYGYRTYHFIPMMWLFILPPIATVISHYSYYKLTYDSTFFVGKTWMRVLGSLAALCSIIWIPVGVLHELASHPGSFKQCFIKSITPTLLPAGIKEPNPGNEIPMIRIEPHTDRQPAVVSDPLLTEVEIESAPLSADSSALSSNDEVVTEKNG